VSHEIEFRKRSRQSNSLIKINESKLSQYSNALGLEIKINNRKKQSVSLINIEKQKKKINALKEQHRKINSVQSYKKSDGHLRNTS